MSDECWDYTGLNHILRKAILLDSVSGVAAR
jgi:hypothetical protein